MTSRIGRADRTTVPVGGSSPEVSRPDPEVPERAKRRYFSAQYKLRVLEEADACQAPGEVGALLRREGLYSSQLTAWRRARREGSLQALSKPRGPRAVVGTRWPAKTSACARKTPVCGGVWSRPRRFSRSKKKASEILGIPLNRPANADDA